MQQLLLTNIKAELSNTVGKGKKKTQPESVEPCKINEAADYAEQLRKELTTSVEEQRLPVKKISDAESPSSDVLEPVTRISRVPAKSNEELSSTDSDGEETGRISWVLIALIHRLCREFDAGC